jgi:hypothetical protein
LPSDAKINETDTFGGEEGEGDVEFEEDSGDSDGELVLWECLPCALPDLNCAQTTTWTTSRCVLSPRFGIPSAVEWPRSDKTPICGLIPSLRLSRRLSALPCAVSACTFLTTKMRFCQTPHVCDGGAL